jgi:hypothetical protein
VASRHESPPLPRVAASEPQQMFRGGRPLEDGMFVGVSVDTSTVALRPV